MGNVKGTCVKSVANFARERIGQKGWEDVLASLGGEDRKLFAGLITATSWYPLETYQRFLATLGRRLGGDPRLLGIEIGRRITADGLNSVYRIFLGMLSTKYLLSKTPLLWKSYFDSERLEIDEVTDKSFQFSAYGEGAPNTIYCHTILGGGLQAISLSGGKNSAGEEIQCRAQGDTCCKYRISWK
jgi:uncharacterized protein (TIGR02265 family)